MISNSISSKLANSNPQTTTRTKSRKTKIKDFNAEAGEDDKRIFRIIAQMFYADL